MTHLCEKIISTLPSWRKMNGPNQLMSLQQFVYDVQDQLNPLASEDDLRHIAQQLHSIGEVSNLHSCNINKIVTSTYLMGLYKCSERLFFVCLFFLLTAETWTASNLSLHILCIFQRTHGRKMMPPYMLNFGAAQYHLEVV